MISIEHVNKSYNDKLAVRDLNLEIPDGEVFAFLGPNGAGKTTTSKMIVGLLKPTSGTITVAGLDIADDYEEVKKVVSYVPDQPYVYDKLTGREFLYFIGRMYELDEEEIGDKIEHYVKVFETTEYVDNMIESYSHGMKQRMVISAALMHDPRIIVVDEPLVGLDPRSSRIVKDLFREKAEEGATIFMSTHMISVAEETADRIGIIHRGRLIACGTPAELREAGNAGLEDIFLQLTKEDNSHGVSL